MTSTSDLKKRQMAKMREIGEALVAAGYDNLDSQAAALGLSRSTMWTIIKATHKSSGLSGKTLKRMLSAPGLHPLVRRKILEYIEERNDGRYGNTGNSLRRFNQRLGHLVPATKGPASVNKASESGITHKDLLEDYGPYDGN